MSTLEVRFHPETRRELRAAVQFYAKEAAGLGRDLVQEVRAAVTRIAEWPESGSPTEDDVHRAVLARFPFTLIYQVLPQGIEIIAVMHQRQKPGYWEGRA